MKNEDDLTEKNPSKHTVGRKNATEEEQDSLAELKISTVRVETEKEKSTTRGMNSFREETAGENNGTLKQTIAPESYSNGIDDIEEKNELVRETKDEEKNAKITSVDQLDKMHEHSLRNELLADEPKREIKSLERIRDVAMTGRRRRQRPFCDIIGKREQRREELEKTEGNLRQRLDMLECSMPAVMVWNIWRMAQGAPACKMKRILEKQFKETAASELVCRGTPSRHYDCRVREIEAERKLALKKAEEARTLWAEKLVMLEERKKKLEEVKKIQEEKRDTMERLSEEVEALREVTERVEVDESCQYGECGDTQCKRRWLDKVSSVTSIESGDIECLEKLQQLAEEEMVIKRDIAEFERREEAYMRTLQQADELWSKIEDEAISTTSALQEQLDMKTAANQQLADRVCELEDALETCRTRMAACMTELEKFVSIEKIEATVGRDDDVAEVVDKEVAVKAEVVHRLIGRVDDVAMVKDDEALARIEVADEEISARIALIDADAEATFVGDDKYVSVKPELIDLAVDRQVDLVRIEDAESAVRPDDFDYEQQRFKEVRKYLAKLGSLEELYKDGEPCAPDFVCNDEVFSPTGMTDEELIALDVEPSESAKKLERELIVNKKEREGQFQEELAKEANDVTDDIEKKEWTTDQIPSVETEGKVVVEKVEERIAEVADVPAITRRMIQEKATDDGSVTMPDDVRAPEVEKLEVDQDVVIQRDKILSWVDTIDTIRATLAKHPNDHVVKEDADVLAEKIGAYIGVKPKVVAEELITIEDKIIEKDKDGDEREVETKVKAEVKFDKENTTFMPEVKKDLNSDIVPLTGHISNEVKNEKIEIDEETRAKEIITEKAKIFQINKIETNEEEDKEKTLIVEEIEKNEEEIMPDGLEKIEIKVEDVPKEVVIEKEEIAEETISPVSVDKAEELIADKVPPIVELTELEKIEPSEFPIVDVAKIPISDVMEEKIKVEAPPSLNMKEEKLEVEELPVADTIIEEKIEVKELPILDTRETVTEEKEFEIEERITDMIQEKIETKEPSLVAEVTEDIVEAPITDVAKEEIQIEIIPTGVKEATVEVKEPIPDVIIEEKVEIEESITDMIQEKMEIEEAPLITEIEEKVETIQPITEPSIIREEVEERIEEPVLQVEIKEEKIEEVPERAIPFIEPLEEREELPLIEKDEILEEVAPPMEPTMIEEKKEEVQLIEEKPEIIKIEEKLPEIKPAEAVEAPTIPTEPHLAVKPYFVIAKIEERELLHIIPAIKPPCTECESVICRMQPPAESAQITRTDILRQTEITHAEITTQTVSTAEPRMPPVRIISEYLKSSELKASTKIAGDRPEITGRKMLWRLKDQSTVTTISTGSQTDKTSHVSHDRVERERARVPTDELLRSIKIAAGQLTRGDTEREIRTINYGRKSDEMRKVACNCCLCGKTTSLAPIRPRLQIQPQIDAKTTTPPATAFKRVLVPPKIDRPIPYNRLCTDCKAKIQGKMPPEKHHVEKMVKKISHDQESCSCAAMPGKPCRRAASRKRAIEKRDQSCLAKISKRKTDAIEQKRKDDSQTISENAKKSDIEPLSPSCICFKLEKIEPMRKGNCNCAD